MDDAAPIELVLGGPAAGGGFVARGPDGRVVFVRHGLPGERVLAVLTEEHATWARADAVEVLEPSRDRVVAPCPNAGPSACGGCDYQHVTLAAQRSLKAQRVEEQLRGLAKLERVVTVEPATETGGGLGTRTRVRFAVDDDGRLSMRQNRSHDLVAVDHCPLGVAAIEDLGLASRSWPVGAEVEVAVLAGTAPATVVVTEGSPRGRRTFATIEASGLAAAQAVTVRGEQFDVPAGSFWQVHVRGPELLVDAVSDGLALAPGDHVLDLYCGVGLFTAIAARAVGDRGAVIGVDAAATATTAARSNLSFAPWARVVTARVDRASVARHVAGATHAVMDPPRRGVDRSALDVLSESPSLQRLVSVSCEPSTFARDLRVLLDAGWRLVTIRALDLFEMTEHVECVAVLER